MRIRSHLLVLAFGVILPFAAFAIYVTTLLVEREQQTLADGAVERLRSTMNAIDAQVQGQIMVLTALAASRALEADDIAGFAVSAKRVLDTQSSWTNVLLALPDGRQIVNTAAPWRTKENPYLVEGDLAGRIVKTRAPVVGSVFVGPGTKRRGINIAVPVIRGNEVIYIIVAFLKPDLFLTPIERQRLGARWVSGLVDSHGTFVARIPASSTEKASAGFLKAVAASPEGWFRGTTTEGTDSFSAHITSPLTRWSLGLGIPADEVLAGARRTAWSMAAGLVGCLALAAFLALWLGRRVTRPVVAIASSAAGIAAGTPVNVHGLERVTEIETVAVALNDAAAAVRERQTLLEREKRTLQEADRAKDEFIAMMSHELRNPLAALSSASQLLDMVPPDHPSAQHAREVIKRQTKHTARLIEDLLDVSRVVMGKAYLQPEIFDLADAASALFEAWRASGRFEQHRVTLEASPAWIRGDRSRVEQILSNLLDNALKFTPENRGIKVSVSSDSSDVTMSVVDEGPGLTPELLQRAFDLFVQGSQGLARKSGGMGIGLALVRRLAELQGGTVTVTSIEGRGAAFSVRFPAVPATRAAGTSATASKEVKPRRILLIEDNEDARKTFAASLAIQGHEVFQAHDGHSGVEAARKMVPEVVIIDIGLPDIDGYEVAKRLRSHASTFGMGLVALTGYGQREDKQKAVEAGFDEHLTKPVDAGTLDEAIALAGSRLK